MAADATVARSTGKITLSAATSYTVQLTEDADYVEIVNGTNAMLYYSVTNAESNIADEATAGVRAVPSNSIGRHPWAAGQWVELESTGGGDACIQLVNDR